MRPNNYLQTKHILYSHALSSSLGTGWLEPLGIMYAPLWAPVNPHITRQYDTEGLKRSSHFGPHYDGYFCLDFFGIFCSSQNKKFREHILRNQIKTELIKTLNQHLLKA